MQSLDVLNEEDAHFLAMAAGQAALLESNGERGQSEYLVCYN